MGLENIVLLAGGLGLFLFGMKIMGAGLELAAGSKLRTLLEKLTSNKFLGVLVGIVVTAIIQSSSATTVMVIGFVNAGLMNLAQSVGIIMGANIGTTFTNVLIALKLNDIAPIALFVGVVMITFSKKKNVNHIGEIIAGFGILFMGMNTMSSAMAPLRDFQPFQDFITNFQNPLLGVLAGLAITAIIQSSSASVGILQALALQGLIGIDSAIFILLGQNIGTCVTALISSVGTTKTAKRAAMIHLLFNVIGSGMFILIALLTPLTSWLSAIPGGAVVQISATHIIFNVVTTLVLFPFSNLLVKLSQKIVPGKDKAVEPMRCEYIDDRFLTTPPIAVAQVIKEVERMAQIARDNLNTAMEAFVSLDKEKVDSVHSVENVLNYLNHNITAYLIKVNSLELQASDFKTVGSLFHVVNDLERIGDHAKNIAEDVVQCVDGGFVLSDDALDEVMELYDDALIALDSALGIFRSHRFDKEKDDVLGKLEDEIDRKSELFKIHHIERLNNNQCSPDAGMVFTNFISNIERVADHATNIAYSVADTY